MGTLVGIATKDAPRGPMRETDSADLSLEFGVGRDARGKPGPRQVSVLSRDAWQRACTDLGAEVPWTLRRANLLVEGLEFEETVGRFLHIGDAVLQISEETKPCRRMERQRSGLRKALAPEWRGGVSCRIVTPGRVRIGDPVKLDDAEAVPERARRSDPMTEVRENAEVDHADVIVMPPALYLVSLVLGVVAKGILGGTILPGSTLRTLAGVVSLGVGIGFVIWFSRAFEASGQDRSPREPSPEILTHGLYRYSRNPAYVGLTAILAGLGLLLDNPWILLAVIPTVLIMQYGVIHREEAYLERTFGEEYRAYKARVRRWL